jgi:hypothetical protein
MGTTPEKCRENVERLRDIMGKTKDPDTRLKLVDVIQAWEDLCVELEAKEPSPTRRPAGEKV